MKWFLRRKITNAGPLFSGHFLDVKVFYIVEFDRVPCVQFISELDAAEAYSYIADVFKTDITNTYQHCYFDQAEQKSFFNNTVFVLTGNRMIELGANYCHLLHGPESYAWANRVVKKLAEFQSAASSSAQVQVVGFARQPEMN